MQRRKKQLLGLVGLALVAVVTAIACALPAPEASATNSDQVKVTVSVGSEGYVPEVRIEDFAIEGLDGNEYVVRQNFHVKVSYINADQLGVILKLNDGTSTTLRAVTEVQVDTSSCELNADTHSWQSCELDYDLSSFDLSSPDGVAFLTRATVSNNYAGNSDEDARAFIYRAAYLKDSYDYDLTNGDPNMYAAFGTGVMAAEVQVFDKDGKPVLVNSDGEETPLVLKNISGNDNYKISLPLTQYGAAAGEYTVVLTAYDREDYGDAEDALIAMSAVQRVKYKVDGAPGSPENPLKPGGSTDPENPDDPNKPTDPDNPDNPDVPGTGLNLFGGLNISSADYILTGLVAFGMVTIFAIFLIVRRNKQGN